MNALPTSLIALRVFHCIHLCRWLFSLLALGLLVYSCVTKNISCRLSKEHGIKNRLICVLANKILKVKTIVDCTLEKCIDKLMNPSAQVSSLQVDVDNPNFYNNVEDVINNDIANLKKSITIDRNLRIEAAEMEVETAALYLNMHWSEPDEFKQLYEQKAEFVRMLNALLASLNRV